MKTKVFITGGSGFIGKNLVQKLNRKYFLLAPSHKQLDLLDEDKVEKYLKDFKVDVVIHGSNVGGTRDTLTLPKVAANNLRMFFNIVRCKKFYKKMIFLGSGAEYDKRKPLVKIKEGEFDRSVPTDEYGFSKYVCSKFVQQSEGIVNLRLFGVYGKYEDYGLRFISYAVCRNILGLPIDIKQNVVFDYLYVNDLVKIIDFFIEHETREKFFNVGRGIKIDLLKIANAVNAVSKKNVKITIKKKGLNEEYTCDNRKLMKTIKGLKFTDFDESLKDLFTYYRSIQRSLDLSRLK